MRCLAVLLLAACGTSGQPPGGDDAEEVGRCTSFEGKTFASNAELECGLTPDGVAHCKWQLTFSANDATSSTYMWRYSDVAESERVTCNGNALVGLTAGGQQTYAGTYDPNTQTLVWQDQPYSPAP